MAKEKFNILIIGNGGREHALGWKIRQSDLVNKLYVAPGNAGLAGIAQCVPLDVMDFKLLADFVREHQVHLTIVGPEAPLVEGIVDYFQSQGLLILGPTRQAAQLEGSKIFSKKLMQEAGVPTARYEDFTDAVKAKEHIIDFEPPFVIKADGLAAGKGVVIAQTAEEGIKAIDNMILNRAFGAAGEKIIIEDYLEGEELSVIAFTDGENILPLVTAQDHKRAFDHDEGPNTGGMGACSPSPFVNQNDVTVIVNKTIAPVVKALKQKGIVYRGIIYGGLMITKSGPMVLEFNVRFGDPEAQAIIPRMRSDIVPILFEAARGSIDSQSISWDARPCISVVMASKGYPNDYHKGFEIEGLDLISPEEGLVFHAGTQLDNRGKILTYGGRVLAVSALGDNLRDAQRRAYEAIAKIRCTNLFYRKDIGEKAIRGCEFV